MKSLHEGPDKHLNGGSMSDLRESMGMWPFRGRRLATSRQWIALGLCMLMAVGVLGASSCGSSTSSSASVEASASPAASPRPSEPAQVTMAATPSRSSQPLSPSLARTRLAFVRGDHVWTIAGDGSQRVRVTRGDARDRNPVWSPDGKAIAFIRETGVMEEFSVCLVPADGGEVVTLYRIPQPHSGVCSPGRLAWSPDGKLLAFGATRTELSQRDQTSQVVALRLDTGETRVLLERTNGFDSTIDASWSPCWSPDGKSLLIAQGGLDAENGETWILRSAEGRPRPLPVTAASFSVWAPDGDRILISTGTQQRTSILLARPDGRRIATLATGGGWEGVPSVGEARYSSDGSWIAYRKGEDEVWLMRADGGERHKLTTGASPSWQ